MGFFNNLQENLAVSIYEKQVEKYIKKKDGKIHTLMLVSFSKIANTGLSVEDKYTTQIEYIINQMQNDGYEIVDIKINVIAEKATFSSSDGFYTLIIYK